MRQSDYTVEEYRARWGEVEAESNALNGLSMCDRIALCESSSPGFTRRLLSAMKPIDWLRLVYDFRFWARPKQLPPAGDWFQWFNIGGRGAGKTWISTQFVLGRIERGEARSIAFIGENDERVQEVLFGGSKKLSEGYNGSGFLDILPPWAKVNYREDLGVAEVTIGKREATIRSVSAHKAEWRGSGTDTVVGTELSLWRRPMDLLASVHQTMRDKRGLKGEPRIVLDTNPRKVKFLRDMVMNRSTITRWHRQVENRTNLSRRFVSEMQSQYGGTARGLEEIEGVLGVDAEGTIFSLDTIEFHRKWERPESFDDGVVSIDPATTRKRKSDETAIVVEGRVGSKRGGQLYVLDEKAGKMTPEQWGEAAIDFAVKYGFDILAETNAGGDLVASNIRACMYRKSRNVKIREVTNDKYGGDKARRAEPLSTLYERGAIHHVGIIRRLEDVMTSWVPGDTDSPDLLDALVNGAGALLDLDERLKGAAAVIETVKANEILDAALDGRIADHLLGSRGGIVSRRALGGRRAF